MNSIRLEGRVGKYVNTYQAKSGSEVFKFFLGVPEKDRDGNWGEVLHPVVCFGKVVEVARPLAEPGAKLYVEGKLARGKYQQKDGTWRHTADVVAFVVDRAGASVIERLENELARLRKDPAQ